MTPEAGTLQNPLVTWNLYLTLGGGVILGLMIRYWFSVMNQKAEERYRQYVESVNCKQDKEICTKIHDKEDERHKEMKCDVKEIKEQTNAILTHLTGIQH